MHATRVSNRKYAQLHAANTSESTRAAQPPPMRPLLPYAALRTPIATGRHLRVIAPRTTLRRRRIVALVVSLWVQLGAPHAPSSQRREAATKRPSGSRSIEAAAASRRVAITTTPSQWNAE